MLASIADDVARNFAGARYGRFFNWTPDYVDVSKPPGLSTLPTPTFTAWVVNAITLRHVWASPNTVWAVIALAMYFFFPYDLSPTGAAAAAPLSLRFFAERFPLWAVVTFGYNAFFHVTLYGLGWASRPFIKGRTYNWDKVAHNLFFGLTGVVIWVGFENVFTFLWASGRLPYMPDAEAATTVAGAARFLAALAFIPVWRDAHFYFAHRLLHVKPLFNAVHSLHHRNTDIEPFAGLCMHPVEHLYYYACVLPSLFLYLSPFAFLWNGVHLMISPGASHSGWEDHWHADAFHYMHHLYFEKNYAGYGAGWLDVAFGSFMPRFKEEGGAQPRADAKSTLREAPAAGFFTYLAASGACVAAWAVAADYYAAAPGAAKMSQPVAVGLALLAGFGPVAVALAMFGGGKGPKGEGSPMFDPKAKGASMLIAAVGTLFCSVPVAAACYLAIV